MTQYEPGAFNPGPHTEWNCQLLKRTPAAKGKSGKIIKLVDIYNLPEGTLQQFESGASILKISGANVASAAVSVRKGAAATITSFRRNGPPTKISDNDNLFSAGERGLQTVNVNKKVLVVRVKTQSATTTATAAQLSDEVFGAGPNGDPFNLVTQYNACSYGKLTVSPLRKLNEGDPALDAPGVYEVDISSSITNHEELREAITDKLNTDWPKTNLPDTSWGGLDGTVPFDHVLYCMPPGTEMGIAYAFVNSWLSVYYDEWCSYPSGKLWRDPCCS